jgi:hypothetical protein
MEAYIVFGDVSYRHVASSSVLRESVVIIVVKERFPEGDASDRAGGVVSPTTESTLNEIV